MILAMLGGGTGLASWLYIVRVEPPRREVDPLSPLVESLVVQREDVTEHFLGYGTVEAERVAMLSAELSANVVERVGRIDSGSFVSKGQLLLVLDDREYRFILARALALTEAEEASLDEISVDAEELSHMVKTAQRELDVAMSEKKRVSDLFERELAAEKEYNVAITAYQQSRLLFLGYERELAKLVPRMKRLEASKRSYDASAALARLNVERCKIVAPFTGRIQTLMVDVGDHVAPGVVLMKLIDTTHVKISIQLPAAVYDRIKISATCRIECESKPQSIWHGEVSRIGPDVDEQTRTFSVYVRVNNSDQPHPLIPGMFIQAQVIGPTYSDCVLVPRGAVRNNRVYIAINGMVHERSVSVERYILDRAIIVGDITEGETVILSRLEDLSAGSSVRVDPAMNP